jgi:PAS domain S-box
MRQATSEKTGAFSSMPALLEQRFSALIESSDDAIVSKSLDGIIESWNPAAERIFGYSATEAIGQPITIVIPQDRHDEEIQILNRIRRGERIEHYETVRRKKDGSLIDISLTVSPIKNSDGQIIGASKIARDITERKHAEERMSILAHEADHRAKNILATVLAIARMTKASSVPEFVTIFSGRVAALERAHRLLVESRWQGAHLKGLLSEELAPFSADGSWWRVSITGPEVLLGPRAAQTFAMAIHELATNAAKYGSLSNPGGQVSAEWTFGSHDELIFKWTEASGPDVRKPSRAGFGTRMIKSVIEDQFKGSVALNWRPEGLECVISISRDQLKERIPSN